MRTHAKHLTIVQENHFQSKIVDISQTLRIFQTISKAWENTKFERSLIMTTGWRIRIQLLRRGIVCLIKILKSYSRVGNKQEKQFQLLRKLQQFLLFYVELLENQAVEYKTFYLKDLLYRLTQIQVLSFNLSKYHEDVRCMLYWKPISYYQESRFNKLKFQYFLQVGHLHLQFKLFNMAIINYRDAITECQYILGDIIEQDFHLKYLKDQFFKVLNWIVLILYFLSIVYELKSDYNKLLESYKLASWLADLTDNFGLSTFIDEKYKQNYQQYYTFLIEYKEMNQILAPIFPQSNQFYQDNYVNDLWTSFNNKFYNKLNKEVNLQLYSILQQPEESILLKKWFRLTEQETTMQSNIHTPRQHEKCRTFNSLDDIKTSKQTTMNHTPQNSHRVTASQQIKPRTFKFTTDIDTFVKRFPQREIESFSSLKAKKELDLYYQQKVLKSYEDAIQIKSLKSVVKQIQSQEEVDKVCQSDLIVGKKLLKFQKYTHQRVATHSNIMKIISDISKEQEHLESVNSARLAIQNPSDLEHKIRAQMQQIIKRKSMHNEGELMNLKNLVSDYESKLSKVPTFHEQPLEQQSCITKHLREKNNQIVKSIDQAIKRSAPEQAKVRKSFLSRVQESLFKK